jgi:cyclopropane fatty-acyl-phospholipid synthase-like methyltransferase
MMKEFWEERYSAKDFAYGIDPNVYFADCLDGLEPARLFCPAEGEGRNAVYAASLGWQVEACDLSEAGRAKTLQLAADKGVELSYQVGDFGQLEYPEEHFDAIALIFAHFPPPLKADYYKRMETLLKKGGYLIIEVFSKSHLEYQKKYPKIGGPPVEAALYSVEEIQSYFPNIEFQELREAEVDLDEGLYHIGKGSVIRAFGKKV